MTLTRTGSRLDARSIGNGKKGGGFMDLLHLHEIKNKMIGNYISSLEYYTSIIKNTNDMAIWIKGLRYLEEMSETISEAYKILISAKEEETGFFEIYCEMMNKNRIINECIMTNMFSLLMEVCGDL